MFTKKFLTPLLLAAVSIVISIPSVVVKADMPPRMIIDYHVIIDAENYQSGRVSIIERVTLSPSWLENWQQTHPNMELDGILQLSREVNVTAGGTYFEIAFMPMAARTESGDVRLRVTSGVSSPVTLEGPMCDYDCQSPLVEVINLPAGTFMQQKNADKFTQSTYMGKDTITWSILDISQGVAFNFLPPAIAPAQNVIRFILNYGVPGIVGAIVLFLVSLIVPMFRQKVSGWLGQRFFGKGANTAS